MKRHEKENIINLNILRYCFCLKYNVMVNILYLSNIIFGKLKKNKQVHTEISSLTEDKDPP